jgi:CarD family transcriptional regulator
LFRRANGKELSIMERKLYESAYNLVKTEIALSKGVPQEEAGNIVSDILANSIGQPIERDPSEIEAEVNSEPTEDFP